MKHIFIEGCAHGAFENDIEALLKTREFVNYLPLSFKDPPPLKPCDDDW